MNNTDLFNLLCIPPLAIGNSGSDIPISTWKKAAKYCEEQRAFLIIDAPKNWTVENVETTEPVKISDFNAIVRKNAAIFFPRLMLVDPINVGNAEHFAPCGAVAGMMSRIDAIRGVMKASAGKEAYLIAVKDLSINLTDKENEQMSSFGINCFRSFPDAGILCLGAQTLEGQDTDGSDWKYIPVRRLALFIEESLNRGTQWVIFEPNGEPLWSTIRRNIHAFMSSLFRQGAFKGTTPNKAFYIKCDTENNPQGVRDLGIVNIEVGFAPLKPAEFVILRIYQKTAPV